MWSSALIVVFSVCKETEDIAREEDAKEEEMAKKEAEKKQKRKRERVCIVCHTYILLSYILSDRFGCIYNFLLVFESCYNSADATFHPPLCHVLQERAIGHGML